MKSEPELNEIDLDFAIYYGYTDEELDFVINYDINYRMGSADRHDGDE